IPPQGRPRSRPATPTTTGPRHPPGWRGPVCAEALRREMLGGAGHRRALAPGGPTEAGPAPGRERRSALPADGAAPALGAAAAVVTARTVVAAEGTLAVTTRALAPARPAVRADAQLAPPELRPADAVHLLGAQRAADLDQREVREDLDLADVLPVQSALEIGRASCRE